MGRKNRSEDFFFAAGVLFVSWILLFSKAPYRLDFKEQVSIFLFGADRINWYLSNPAVFASIAGDWLTQFYVNSTLAATLSVFLFALIMAGLARFFRLAEPDRPVCLILSAVPVLFEGYFITFPNYPVSATVGLTVSIWSACALAHLKNSKFSYLIYGIAVPALFVIAGGHAITTALLLAFVKRRDGIAPMISIAAGMALLLILGRLYNLTMFQTLLWPVTPGYINPPEWLLILMPWIILGVMILSLHYHKVMDKRWKNVILPLLFVAGIPLSVTAFGAEELENTVKIGTLAYRNEWKEVKLMASSHKPGFYKIFYWNVCNARQGHLADELLNNGGWGRSSDMLFLSTVKGDPYFSMMYYTDALLEMGDVSQATDCALLAQTVMPGYYSTRMLRRLAEIAVVTGDYAVATKYLNILIRTRNHRNWAQNLLDCIAADKIPEQYLQWRSRTVPEDRFFVQGDIRSSLSIIASQSPYNRVAVDYLLCSYLLDKNVNTFISLYDRYYLNALDRIVSVPDLYQEALLVNVNSRESLIETVEKYHISQRVYDKYMQLLEARAGDSRPESVITTEAMRTYWHFIMVMRYNNTENQ